MISNIKNKLILISIFNLLLEAIDVQSQTGNCHFDGIADDATFLNITGIMELTPENGTLWSAPTQNVVQAAAVPSPHIKYISGLRYSSRYEYVATADFFTFITLERSTEIRRDVVFTCSNGGTRPITFYFHLEDENNFAPELNTTETMITVRKSAAIGDVDMIGLYVAVDLDLWPSNANVTVESSRRQFPAQARLKEGVDHIKEGWTWEILLNIVWAEASIGEWNFAVIASDGKWTRLMSVVVLVQG